jgi:hypothetical protein
VGLLTFLTLAYACKYVVTIRTPTPTSGSSIIYCLQLFFLRFRYVVKILTLPIVMKQLLSVMNLILMVLSLGVAFVGYHVEQHSEVGR